ncbi:MAG: LysE family translocator [Planctomycetia bacterium]|nr:LysE family translocator [Planctomycetia bacterium]MDO5112820.1 LysE family translocator [Planctomycetia bacterium]
MFGIEHYGLFILSSILLCLTPGVDTFYILGKTLSTRTWISPIISSLGITTGILLHTLCVSLGITLLVAQSLWLFQTIKILGACYLLYLGIQTWRQRHLLPTTNYKKIENHSLWKDFFQGVLVDFLNPKVALFFLAFLPQFVNPQYVESPWPILLLGWTFYGIGTLWLILVVSVSHFLGERFLKNPNYSRRMNSVCSLLYIFLGCGLLLEKE